MGKRGANSFPRTDSGNAELIAVKYCDKLRFDHKRNRWLIWTDRRWIEDLDGEVIRLAKEAARDRWRASSQLRDDDSRKVAGEWALRSESRYGLKAAIELAKSTPPIADRGENWDSDPLLLGVRNGLVDLRTRRLREATPEDRVTIYSPVTFDPLAGCPRFEQFLREVFIGDADLIDFIQRAIGYCLSGSVVEQCLFLCYGQGANGKSTFLEILRHVLGGYACNLPFSAFELEKQSGSSHELAGLVSKRFVTAVETTEGIRLNEGRIKALTGGDCITARHLYSEYFTFNPTAKFWLAFNHKPVVTDTSHGYWRRARLIPFLATFDERQKDPGLLAKLQSEASGILAWAVRGCEMWQRRGLGIPDAIQLATHEYKDESDPVGEFIEEKYERSAEGFVESIVLTTEYAAWAMSNDVETLDRKALANRLRALGLVSTRHGHDRIRGWRGLRTKNVAEPAAGTPPADTRTDADTKIQ